MNKAQLLAKTKAELLEMAQRLGLRGISTLKKSDLAERVYEAQLKRTGPLPKQPLGVVSLAQQAADLVKRRAIRKRAGASPAEAEPAPTRRVATPAASEIAEEVSAHKFEVTPPAQPVKQQLTDEKLGDLPESYGTERLYLTARDPRWLYAYWDMSSQQLARHRMKSADGRVVLRVFEQNHRDPIQEITLTPEARNWYLPVPKPSTTYRAQLGYWLPTGRFHVISESREATTPAETISPTRAAQFVTIPLDISFRDLYGLVREHVQAGENLGAALGRLQAAGFEFPFRRGAAAQISEDQQALLAHLLYDDLLKRIQAGSFEISEWLRKRLAEELSSGLFSAGFSPGGASWGSGPLGQPARGFWFAVNAELIIYGATEPDATVTVDGKPIKLRPDGTFSFHYVFPDGEYRMPIVAVAKDGHDSRAVSLKFERRTTERGEVGKVKQPAHLKEPVTV
jgi:hypothetical protein